MGLGEFASFDSAGPLVFSPILSEEVGPWFEKRHFLRSWWR